MKLESILTDHNLWSVDVPRCEGNTWVLVSSGTTTLWDRTPLVTWDQEKLGRGSPWTGPRFRPWTLLRKDGRTQFNGRSLYLIFFNSWWRRFHRFCYGFNLKTSGKRVDSRINFNLIVFPFTLTKEESGET